MSTGNKSCLNCRFLKGCRHLKVHPLSLYGEPLGERQLRIRLCGEWEASR